MKLRQIVLTMALVWSSSVLANFEDGSAALERGEYAVALKLLSPLAEQGHAAAQNSLGFMYTHGQGVPQDYTKALKWYRKSAEQGLDEAQLNLGLLYAQGQGVEQDSIQALAWVLLAIIQGNELAQEKSLTVARNMTPEQITEAQVLAKQLRQNINRRNSVDPGASEDQGEDIDHILDEYERSSQRTDYQITKLMANQGDAESQFRLGLIYVNAVNIEEAVKWFRLAAEQGYAEAQYYLGAAYEYGEGLTQDFDEAVTWYRKSAEQGIDGAQLNLGLLYARGQGVEQDSIQALAWVILALSQGNELARKRISIIAQKMTPEHIAEAEALAKQLAGQIDSR